MAQALAGGSLDPPQNHPLALAADPWAQSLSSFIQPVKGPLRVRVRPQLCCGDCGQPPACGATAWRCGPAPRQEPQHATGNRTIAWLEPLPDTGAAQTWMAPAGGEQQRVAIARALINRPPVILADEPTAPLDGQRALAVVGLLNDMARQFDTAIIIVTHDEKIIPTFNRLYNIRDGKTVEETPGHDAPEPPVGS